MTEAEESLYNPALPGIQPTRSYVRRLRRPNRNDDATVPEIKSEVGKLIVAGLYHVGFPQKRIAALFDENQGRVAEVVAELGKVR